MILSTTRVFFDPQLQALYTPKPPVTLELPHELERMVETYNGGLVVAFMDSWPDSFLAVAVHVSDLRIEVLDTWEGPLERAGNFTAKFHNPVLVTSLVHYDHEHQLEQITGLKRNRVQQYANILDFLLPVWEKHMERAMVTADSTALWDELKHLSRAVIKYVDETRVEYHLPRYGKNGYSVAMMLAVFYVYK